jgi:hypothetical protein
MSRPLPYFSPLWQSVIQWPGSPHLKHLGPFIAVLRLGGPIVIGIRFGFVDWVVFRGVNGPLYQVVLLSVPSPK